MMLGCGKFLSVDGEFIVEQVVELLWARPLVVLYNMSVGGVRVVEFGTHSASRQQYGREASRRNREIIDCNNGPNDKLSDKPA